MNIGYIINSLGRISLVMSVFMATSFFWVAYYQEHHVIESIMTSVLIPLILGLLMVLPTRHSKRSNLKDKYVIVVVSWLFIGLIGAMPFYLSGYIPGFIDALFESVSGITTTGASILTDIEALPLSILWWRSLLQWIGGMGIIVLVIAIFPTFKNTGHQMFAMELSTALYQKIKPRTADIAKRMWSIYIGFTVILVILLMAGGLDFFESLCHSFSTIATGGFSTKNASIGHYSPYVQYVIALFMWLSGINFALHYFFLKRDFKSVFTNSELRAYIGITAVFIVAIFLILLIHHQHPFEVAIRESVFKVSSMLTSTGFANADYLSWPTHGWMLIFSIMFIGGCTGSTSGGIKIIRHVVAFQYIKKQISQIIHPKAIKKIKVNQRSVSDAQANSIIMFILIYLVVMMFGIFIMSLMGLSLRSAIGTVVASLGGYGPGIGCVGPSANYAHIPEVGKVFLFMLMIIGRLEILTFIILLTPDFWNKKMPMGE